MMKLFIALTVGSACAFVPTSVRTGAKTVVSDTPADLDKLAVELNPAVKFWDPLNLAEAEFWEESNEATIVSIIPTARQARLPTKSGRARRMHTLLLLFSVA